MHLALGASPSRVMRRTLGEAGRDVITGLALGLPVCLILSRLMRSSVFGIAAFHPNVYIVVPVLLKLITTLACVVPARRAARIAPMTLLREE